MSKLAPSVRFLFSLAPLAVLCLIAGQAQASPSALQCQAAFDPSSQATLTFEELPRLQEHPLPAAFIAALRLDPAVRRLQSRFGDGALLAISIANLNPGQDQQVRTGEDIQKVFVYRVLKEIFPKGQFLNSRGWEAFRFPFVDNFRSFSEQYPGLRRIHLNAHDFAEGAFFGEISDIPINLHLPFIKPANPGNSVLPHGALRRELGLSDSATVVSIYAEAGTSVDAMIRVISAISSRKKPDAIILSRAGSGLGLEEFELGDFPPSHRPTEVEKEFRAKLRNRFTVRTIRPDSNLQSDSRKPVVFLNQTTGQMPNLYNVSNVAIVLGPINPFEALNAGAKTIIVNASLLSAEKRDWYVPKALERLHSIARAAGAMIVANLDELNQRWPEILESDAKNTPTYQVPTQGGKSTTLSDFLSHLEQRFNRSLRLEETSRKSDGNDPQTDER